MLSLVNITSTSALSYQTETDISFTFNPTISISLSSSDLVIPSLTPGTTSESNSINVVVVTNAAYGYTLSATVGNNTYNNSNLNHSNSTDIFSSIATNANLSTLGTDNTWGYATSSDSGSTWSNYNGLSNSSNKKLLDIDTNISSTIGFKIAAKASNTQASGTYSNAINFITVARVSPKTITDLEYLQDFANLDAENLASVKSSMQQHTTYTLKDKRDEQAYTIAKLNDGKIWMTKNLNLAGGTALSSDDTDFEPSYTLPTTDGWTVDNNKLILPASSTNGFSTENYTYLYNSNNNTDDCSNPGCYSYYSWDAATLGSGRNISNSNAPYSICPKGWKLPSTAMGTNSSADFRALLIAYGGSDAIQDYNNNTSPTGAAIYDAIKIGTVPNFLYAGFYENSSFKVGNSYGYYWASTSGGDNNHARVLYLNLPFVSSANRYNRYYGFVIRCLAK